MRPPALGLHKHSFLTLGYCLAGFRRAGGAWAMLLEGMGRSGRPSSSPQGPRRKRKEGDNGIQEDEDGIEAGTGSPSGIKMLSSPSLQILSPTALRPLSMLR